LIFFR